MSDGAKRIRTRLNMRDGLLLGLGALSLVLYFWLLPAHHPDAAADYSLGEAGAGDAAARYLDAVGYATDGLDVEVSFRRLPQLIDSLQATLGRAATVEALQGEAGGRLPAYFWRVTYYRRQALGDDERRRVYTLALSSTGKVWEFSRDFEESALDRNALRAVLMPPGREEDLPATLSDSLLGAKLAFTLGDTVWQAGSPAAPSPAEIVSALEASTGGTVPLGPDWAVALAQHHIAGTIFEAYDVRVDSTYLVRSSTGDRDVAAVRFEAQTPYLGRRPATTLRVVATGALVGMETAFVAPGAPADADEEGDRVTLSVVSEIVVGVLYVLLVLILLAVFFRRLGARLLDTRMALRDALWGGFFAGMVVMNLVGREFMGDFDEPLLALLAAAVVGLLSGLGAALLVLFISSAADSVGRDVWPEKLDAMHLVREASLWNAPVGRALVRGTALASILLGVLTLVLVVFRDLPVHMGDKGAFLSSLALSPLGLTFGRSAFGALFLVLTVLLGLGSLVARRFGPRAAAAVLILVLALESVGPLNLSGIGANWGVGALVGAVLVAAFLRFGALTCFVGYFLLGMLWELSAGWMIAGGPEAVDFWIAFIGALLVLVLGFVGVINGREVGDLQQYVPPYISELAQKERMGRELEIAHQVQEFFLPRRMPEVEGLDVAAMCLAAHEVGGDYYDFIELGPGRLGVAVGDVSGKGIQAAFFMTLTKGFLQTLTRSVDSPAEVLRRLNALFRENAPRGLFVSMIYGVLDVEARTFTFARAGHNPLILTRSPNQEADLIQPAGLAIGLVSGSRFDDHICEETLHLRPGDTLVFYTDGFSEAMNAARVQYGDDRLARKVSEVGRRSANEILRAVTEDVHHFVEAVGRHDDMTMVVVKLARRTDPVMSLSRGRQSGMYDAQHPPVAVES